VVLMLVGVHGYVTAVAGEIAVDNNVVGVISVDTAGAAADDMTATAATSSQARGVDIRCVVAT